MLYLRPNVIDYFSFQLLPVGKFQCILASESFYAKIAGKQVIIDCNFFRAENLVALKRDYGEVKPEKQIESSFHQSEFVSQFPQCRSSTRI